MNCDLCGGERPPERGASHGRYSFCSPGCSAYSSSIRRLYGLTLDEYRVILQAQNYACAICGETPGSDHPSRGFHVDHCHAGSHVRALLCQGCNHMLGGARDRPGVLELGAAYLRKNTQLKIVA